MTKKDRIKKYGEVFTPIFLVDDMLNTLPDEVWNNPNLKWLDPCVGTGNFIIQIVKRLMVGLESYEPDTIKRYDHIINNMIYVCELQEDNIDIYIENIKKLKNEYI